jgi:hypothetical protein
MVKAGASKHYCMVISLPAPYGGNGLFSHIQNGPFLNALAEVIRQQNLWPRDVVHRWESIRELVIDRIESGGASNTSAGTGKENI